MPTSMSLIPILWRDLSLRLCPLTSIALFVGIPTSFPDIDQRTRQLHMERSFKQKARPIGLVETTEQEMVIPRDPTPNEAEDGSARHTSNVIAVSIWRWELAALIASTVFLVALIVTLLQYNNRDLPSWPLSLNLNSLVSMYTTILRALPLVPIAEGEIHNSFYHSSSYLKTMFYT